MSRSEIHAVDEGIRCQFGPGLKVVNIFLGSTAVDAGTVKSLAISTAKHTSSSSNTDELALMCPVCFCVPSEDSMVQLSCGHRYCRICFHAWLCGASHQTCDFPICCLAEGCAKEVEIKDLYTALAHSDFCALLRSALDKHVMANPSRYQFCPSAGCTGIYFLPATVSPESSMKASCSTCQTLICCHCKVQEHKGLTCHKYMVTKLPPDHLRNRIVEDILTLKCPRCAEAFLDFDGCFALFCSACPCSFCGWRLQDCGTDAHPHVLSCTEKVPSAKNETYHGSFEQFEEAQRLRRRTKVIEFLKTLDGMEAQTAALQAIQRDLADLKLNDISLISLS